MYTNAHYSTGPVAVGDGQNYLIVNDLFHDSSISFTRESALFEVTSGLSAFISDTFFLWQVRVGLKIISEFDGTVQEASWCPAASEQGGAGQPPARASAADLSARDRHHRN